MGQTQIMSEKKEILKQEKEMSYLADEVAKHNSETDCWMVINDKVYNVTSFVGSHPGGPAILKGCGIDATALFEKRPTNNKGPHPEVARDQLAKLYIGKLSK